jgi:small subunit ribosomal protein S7
MILAELIKEKVQGLNTELSEIIVKMLSNVPNKKINALFIQKLLKKGKKSKSEFLFSKLSRFLQYHYQIPPQTIIKKALSNLKPLVSFRNVKLRGVPNKMPFFSKEIEGEKLAFQWFLDEKNSTKQKTVFFLAKEIYQAFLKEGNLITKRGLFYKLANQNKVFAYYRWF